MNSCFKMINGKTLSRKNIHYAIAMAYKQGALAALSATQGDFIPADKSGLTICSTASIVHDHDADNAISIVKTVNSALVHASYGRIDNAVSDLKN